MQQYNKAVPDWGAVCFIFLSRPGVTNHCTVVTQWPLTRIHAVLCCVAPANPSPHTQTNTHTLTHLPTGLHLPAVLPSGRVQVDGVRVPKAGSTGHSLRRAARRRMHRRQGQVLWQRAAGEFFLSWSVEVQTHCLQCALSASVGQTKQAVRRICARPSLRPFGQLYTAKTCAAAVAVVAATVTLCPFPARLCQQHCCRRCCCHRVQRV